MVEHSPTMGQTQWNIHHQGTDMVEHSPQWNRHGGTFTTTEQTWWNIHHQGNTVEHSPPGNRHDGTFTIMEQTQWNIHHHGTDMVEHSPPGNRHSSTSTSAKHRRGVKNRSCLSNEHDLQKNKQAWRPPCLATSRKQTHPACPAAQSNN